MTKHFRIFANPLSNFQNFLGIKNAIIKMLTHFKAYKASNIFKIIPELSMEFYEELLINK